MSAKTISQREARRLARRVSELEAVLKMQQSRWTKEWPGGVEIGQFTDTSELVAPQIRTARMLRHAAVATVDERNVVRIYGIRL